MSNTSVNTCSVSLIIGDVHIKTTARHPPTQEGQDRTRVSEDEREADPRALLVALQTGAATMKAVCRFLKKLSIDPACEPATLLRGVCFKDAIFTSKRPEHPGGTAHLLSVASA